MVASLRGGNVHCGDSKCFIKVEGDEDDVTVEPSGESSLLQGISQMSPEITSADTPPYVGQSFRTDDEAQEYYTNFARKNGFAIRRERSKVFGDVVVFDMTYRLYAYDQPVGVWFGVDNYGNAMFFGCVLLQDEKPHSFRWALQSFLRLMDGKFPRTMLTDIDMGLSDAMMSEMPSAKHAFGMWHVISKLPSWFAAPLGSQYDKFVSEFHRLCNLESPVQFNQLWQQMMVAAAVDLLDQAGEEAAMRQNYQNIKTKTCMPIEEHAFSILTPYAFDLFKKEVISSNQYAVFDAEREEQREDRIECYLIKHRLQTDTGHEVSCSASDEEIQCACHEFEASGILCRHALRVLSLKNCFLLPDKYLLARWRCECSLFPKSSGYKYRSLELRSLASIIIQESSVTKDRFDYVQWHMNKLLNHVRDMPNADELGSNVEPSSSYEVPMESL